MLRRQHLRLGNIRADRCFFVLQREPVKPCARFFNLHVAVSTIYNICVTAQYPHSYWKKFM